MNGPQFLLLYFIVEVLLIGTAFIFIKSLSKKVSDTFVASPEVLPIAYLSGGIDYLIYSILFRLHLLDKIKFSKNFDTVKSHKTPETLREQCEKILYEEVSSSKKIKDLNDYKVKNNLKAAIETHPFFVKNPGLIFSESTRNTVTSIRNTVMIILFSLLAYRVITGVMAGMHKFGFLIALGTIGIVAAWRLLRLSYGTTTSWQYVLHLKTLNPFPSQQVFATATNQQKAIYLALYGKPALDHLEWNSVHKNYEQSIKKQKQFSYSTSSSSSCSSISCSSGCSSSSSSSSSSCGSGDSGSSCSGCGGCGGGD